MSAAITCVQTIPLTKERYDNGEDGRRIVVKDGDKFNVTTKRDNKTGWKEDSIFVVERDHVAKKRNAAAANAARVPGGPVAPAPAPVPQITLAKWGSMNDVERNSHLKLFVNDGDRTAFKVGLVAASRKKKAEDAVADGTGDVPVADGTGAAAAVDDGTGDVPVADAKAAVPDDAAAVLAAGAAVPDVPGADVPDVPGAVPGAVPAAAGVPGAAALDDDADPHGMLEHPQSDAAEPEHKPAMRAAPEHEPERPMSAAPDPEPAKGGGKRRKSSKRGRKSTRTGRKSSKKGRKSRKNGRRGKGSRRSKK
jgi:hypothetical protein